MSVVRILKSGLALCLLPILSGCLVGNNDEPIAQQPITGTGHGVGPANAGLRCGYEGEAPDNASEFSISCHLVEKLKKGGERRARALMAGVSLAWQKVEVESGSGLRRVSCQPAPSGLSQNCRIELETPVPTRLRFPALLTSSKEEKSVEDSVVVPYSVSTYGQVPESLVRFSEIETKEPSLSSLGFVPEAIPGRKLFLKLGGQLCARGDRIFFKNGNAIMELLSDGKVRTYAGSAYKGGKFDLSGRLGFGMRSANAELSCLKDSIVLTFHERSGVPTSGTVEFRDQGPVRVIGRAPNHERMPQTTPVYPFEMGPRYHTSPTFDRKGMLFLLPVRKVVGVREWLPWAVWEWRDGVFKLRVQGVVSGETPDTLTAPKPVSEVALPRPHALAEGKNGALYVLHGSRLVQISENMVTPLLGNGRHGEFLPGAPLLATPLLSYDSLRSQADGTLLLSTAQLSSYPVLVVHPEPLRVSVVGDGLARRRRMAATSARGRYFAFDLMERTLLSFDRQGKDVKVHVGSNIEEFELDQGRDSILPVPGFLFATPDELYALAFSSGSSLLALNAKEKKLSRSVSTRITVGVDGRVFFWENSRIFEMVGDEPVELGPYQSPTFVYNLVASPKMIYLYERGGEIGRFDLELGQQIDPITDSGLRLHSRLKVSPEGVLFGISNVESNSGLHRFKGGSWERALPIESRTIYDFAVTKSGNFLLILGTETGANEAVWFISDGEGGYVEQSFFGGQSAPNCGTGTIRKSVPAHEVKVSLRSSLSRICPGNLKSVAVIEKCTTDGSMEVFIGQEFSSVGSIVQVKSPCF